MTRRRDGTRAVIREQPHTGDNTKCGVTNDREEAAEGDMDEEEALEKARGEKGKPWLIVKKWLPSVGSICV